jgi:multimeric flavodoxin WrbA
METMKLLGISASPREHGNSRFLLEVALEAAETAAPGLVETELFSSAGKVFEPCDACDLCHEELGYCKIIGDDFADLRDRWIAADAVIYSVPVYHMGVPGALKNFIDRLGQSVVEGFTSKPVKTVGVLTQGSGMATGQEQVMMFLIGHATMMGCIPVGGEWPGGYLGVGGWTRVLTGEDAIKTLLREGDRDAEFTVKAVRELAKNVVIFTQIVKAGGLALREMLAEDGGYDIFLRRITGQEVPGREREERG